MRLIDERESKSGLSDNQFGFRKGRSTVHAIEKVKNTICSYPEKWCLLITLDVRNAFNSANWSLIMEKLEWWGISRYLVNLIGDYLSDRQLQIESGERITIAAGVPQGSLLGTILWNILFDDIFHIELSTRASTLGYAYDLALIVAANNEIDLMIKGNESLGRLNDWLVNNKLQLGPAKSEAIILKGSRMRQHLKSK
ncbi:Reverse transcriptase (RNA-dependent DNA polymerase) [Popillia japonica]|uniref:Reverse transcriptase (RNA-dependent DNA polymerase) n=1 Tax=Popillia japonica TaxID=7064 RepID=A0AAW1MEL4_POPJA